MTERGINLMIEVYKIAYKVQKADNENSYQSLQSPNETAWKFIKYREVYVFHWNKMWAMETGLDSFKTTLHKFSGMGIGLSMAICQDG